MAVNYWLFWIFAVGVACSKEILNFSYITTKTGSFVSSGAIPVVDLALEQINNRTDILPNYTLSYTTILDSKVTEILVEQVLEAVCISMLLHVLSQSCYIVLY